MRAYGRGLEIHGDHAPIHPALLDAVDSLPPRPAAEFPDTADTSFALPRQALHVSWPCSGQAVQDGPVLPEGRRSRGKEGPGGPTVR